MSPRRPVPRAAATLGIGLQGIALRHLEYTELPIPGGKLDEDLATADRLEITSHADGTVNVYENNVVEFIVDITVEPDPRAKPYRVRARVSMLLTREPGVSDEHLQLFIQQSGMLIVYPYVREIISNVTARGVYGPLFLDPIRPDALILNKA